MFQIYLSGYMMILINSKAWIQITNCQLYSNYFKQRLQHWRTCKIYQI